MPIEAIFQVKCLPQFNIAYSVLFLYSSLREKELKEQCKALLGSKDEELREMKMRYLRFANRSDLSGQMLTAIQHCLLSFVLIFFSQGERAERTM